MLSKADSSPAHALGAPRRLGAVIVTAHNDIADVRDTWRTLEAHGTSTVYQSLLWSQTWVNSALCTTDITPLLINGQNRDGDPLFVLPLQIRRKHGVLILEFLTTPLQSYGHLVCSPWCNTGAGQAWFEEHFISILDMAGYFDVVNLRDMPADLHGLRHPFVAHFNLHAPDSSLTTHFAPDIDTFISQRRSSDSRKNMRWRDTKLARAGKLEFSASLMGSELLQAADELFIHQGRRLAEAGVADPFGESEREFFRALLEKSASSNAVFKLLRLSIDGQGISSILAAFHGNTCSNIMTSLAQTPLRKYSPGDFVLRKLIELGCELGFTHLDLGIGDHDYKRQWASNTLTLHHIISGRTLKGLLYATWLYGEQSIRRVIKKHRVLRTVFFECRRRLFGHSQSAD
jgi:CelD/BcsL family acetyltransferase involved in cellulose biosynthesis